MEGDRVRGEGEGGNGIGRREERGDKGNKDNYKFQYSENKKQSG